MKMHTQRRITFIIPFVLAIVLVVPLLIFPISNTPLEFFGSGMFIFFSILSVLWGIRMLETANINEERIIVKSLFGVIKNGKLSSINDCYIEMLSIPASRGQIVEKCIVIELKDEHIVFRTFRNKKNKNAIKINASEQNIISTSKFIKINDYTESQLIKKRTIQRKNARNEKIDNLVKLIDEILELCNTAILEYDVDPKQANVLGNTMVSSEPQAVRVCYNQIKEIVVPELQKLRNDLRHNGIPKSRDFRLNSNRLKMDSWNLDAPLSKMLTELVIKIKSTQRR